MIVGLHLRAGLVPQHGRAHRGNGRIALLQMLLHACERDARIDEVVDEQHIALQFAARHRDVLRDVEFALLRAGRFAIRTRGENRQRQIVDARELVADAQAAAREAQDLVELPARLVHGQREQFDQPVILVPADPQVLLVVTRIFHRDHRYTLHDSNLERVTQQNRFFAIRTGGNHVDRNTGDFLHAREIRARVGRQLVPFLDADRAFLPAREDFVDGHAARDFGRAARQQIDVLAVDRVADAQLHFIEAVEHVELGHAQARDAVDLDRAAQRGDVEPAGAARTARDRAEFLADGGEFEADRVLTRGVVGVVQFARERTRTDARAVRLRDAENVVQFLRTDARAGSRRTRDAVARRDERIGAVVDIEQRALRAFEQQIAAVGVDVVETARHVGDHRLQTVGVAQHRVERLLEVDCGGAEVLREHEVVIVEVFAQTLGKRLRIEQVLHAQATARDLVFVGRADAAAGRADLARAAARFAALVDRDVVRQDQRGGFGNEQTFLNVDAGGFELADFLEQRFRRQHDAIADVARDAGMHDARRNQTQDGFLAADDKRVTGIVTALEANDALSVVRQPVDDLALAFITPLGTHDDDVAPGVHIHCAGRHVVS